MTNRWTLGMNRFCGLRQFSALLMCACLGLLSDGLLAKEMEYEIEWPLQRASNARLNALAKSGWLLRSASLAPCPDKPAPPAGPQCVMLVIEREKKQ